MNHINIALPWCGILPQDLILWLFFSQVPRTELHRKLRESRRLNGKTIVQRVHWNIFESSWGNWRCLVQDEIFSPNQSEWFVLADPLLKINSQIEQLTGVNNDVHLLHVCFSHKAIVRLQTPWNIVVWRTFIETLKLANFNPYSS